jgi:hypothetical protein
MVQEMFNYPNFQKHEIRMFGFVVGPQKTF